MNRYATSLLFLPDKTFLRMQILEVEKGLVIKYYPFVEELPSTIWLNGLVEVINRKGNLLAYHLTPYDLINRKACDGTQRIQLQ